MARIRPVLLAVGAWAAAWVVNRSLRRVTGPSMAPTLLPGDLVVVLPRVLRPPRRGDVVLVRDPRAPERVTIKRLVGLPGEVVVVRPRVVEADGRTVLGRPRPARGDPDHRWRLGRDRYLVLGDNPPRSTDSRQLGPLPGDLLVAVARWRIRPWGGISARRRAGAGRPGRPG